jgi:hypothetical protein
MRRDKCLLGRCCAPAASGQAAALLPCPTTTATLRSNHVSWIDRFHFLKVAPVSCAIAPSVVCAALRPSRKSLSEYDV